MTGWLAVAAAFITLFGVYTLGLVAFDALADAYRRHLDLGAMRRARKARR